MLNDEERFILLMLLWNFKIEAITAMESGKVPAEEMEAARGRLDRFDDIVKKLGGDPTKPAFGAVAV